MLSSLEQNANYSRIHKCEKHNSQISICTPSLPRNIFSTACQFLWPLTVHYPLWLLNNPPLDSYHFVQYFNYTLNILPICLIPLIFYGIYFCLQNNDSQSVQVFLASLLNIVCQFCFICFYGCIIHTHM